MANNIAFLFYEPFCPPHDDALRFLHYHTTVLTVFFFIIKWQPTGNLGRERALDSKETINLL